MSSLRRHHSRLLFPKAAKSPGGTQHAKAAQQAAATAIGEPSLQNIGQDCWYECKQSSGFCDFCGRGNACCRKGYDADSPKECRGNLSFKTWHHECVVPAAKEEADSAAISHTGNPATPSATHMHQTEVAAGQSPQQVALESPVAAPFLQNIGQDCWYECKQTSGFCDFCGRGNACCRKGYDADSPKECRGNLSFKTWHHECVVPAAKEEADSAAISPAGNPATPSATHMHQTGVAAGQSPQQVALESPVAAPFLQNIGQDCWYECKQTSGFCDFCGRGNACCRKSYGADSPKECRGNLSFTTWHHECVVPDHSQSGMAYQQVAHAAEAAAVSAAAAGAAAGAQAHQAAVAAEQLATQNGIPPEVAAQVAAAGVEQGADEIKAGTKQEQVAEVAQTAAEVAAQAGLGFEQQAKAAAIAAGSAAAKVGLPAADAASIAAAGAASASNAAGDGQDSALAAAAAAAHTAAAAAGESGEALIGTITTSVAKAAASAGMDTNAQLHEAVKSARTYAAAASLSVADAEKSALQTMHALHQTQPGANQVQSPSSATLTIMPGIPPAAMATPTVLPASMPAVPTVAPLEVKTAAVPAAEKTTPKPTPEQLAFQAASKAAATSPEATLQAAKEAAIHAGSSTEQAAEIARAATFAVEGGSASGPAGAAIAPLAEGTKQAKAEEHTFPKSPAEVDAAEAGAEAARGAAAEGKRPAEQAEAAAVAAGKTALNGGMTMVGAEEAARSAAVILGFDKGAAILNRRGSFVSVGLGQHFFTASGHFHLYLHEVFM